MKLSQFIRKRLQTQSETAHSLISTMIKKPQILLFPGLIIKTNYMDSGLVNA